MLHGYQVLRQSAWEAVASASCYASPFWLQAQHGSATPPPVLDLVEHPFCAAMQVPDELAGDIVNVTATGQSYVEFKFKNVTTTDTFLVQRLGGPACSEWRTLPWHV